MPARQFQLLPYLQSVTPFGSSGVTQKKEKRIEKKKKIYIYIDTIGDTAPQSSDVPLASKPHSSAINAVDRAKHVTVYAHAASLAIQSLPLPPS